MEEIVELRGTRRSFASKVASTACVIRNNINVQHSSDDQGDPYLKMDISEMERIKSNDRYDGTKYYIHLTSRLASWSSNEDISGFLSVSGFSSNADVSFTSGAGFVSLVSGT